MMFITCIPTFSGMRILIVQDERPQMDVLAAFLREKGGTEELVIEQHEIPADLNVYEAVLLYIHGALDERVELAVIDYARSGGKLILLHHSISSGKAKNEFFFDFLGIRLDDVGHAREPVQPGGGYAWIEPVTVELVKLNSHHFITSPEVVWPDTVSYASSDQPSVERETPAIILPKAEAYLNHKFTDGRDKTVLMGFKFFDHRNGQMFMQDRAAWLKPAERGWIFYFQPGHSVLDYQNSAVSQVILNAILWRP